MSVNLSSSINRWYWTHIYTGVQQVYIVSWIILRLSCNWAQWLSDASFPCGVLKRTDGCKFWLEKWSKCWNPLNQRSVWKPPNVYCSVCRLWERLSSKLFTAKFMASLIGVITKTARWCGAEVWLYNGTSINVHEAK